MTTNTQQRPRRSTLHTGLIALALLAGLSAASACAHGTTADQSGAPAGHETMAPMAAGMAAVWDARPDYTGVKPATEEAYRYALEHPLVLNWIPCYCGCGGIGHGSNLDCYFQPNDGGTAVFEEHASYCDICVDITLRTKQMAAAGASLSSIRIAIDAEFGGAGPGTDTPRPAS